MERVRDKYRFFKKYRREARENSVAHAGRSLARSDSRAAHLLDRAADREIASGHYESVTVDHMRREFGIAAHETSSLGKGGEVFQAVENV